MRLNSIFIFTLGLMVHSLLVQSTQADERPAPTFLELKQKMDLLDGRQLIPGGNRVGSSLAIVDDLKLTKEQLLKLAVVREEVREMQGKSRISGGGRGSAPPPFLDGPNPPRREDIQDRLRTLREGQQEEQRFAEECDRKLKEILTDDQYGRLEGLYLFQLGATALLRFDVRTRLNLSNGQCFRISDARTTNLNLVLDETAGADYGVECYQILTVEQRELWKQLTGSPVPGMRSMAMIVTEREQALAANPFPRRQLQTTTVTIYNNFMRLQDPVTVRELGLTDDQITQIKEQQVAFAQTRTQRPFGNQLSPAEARESHEKQFEMLNERKRLDEAVLELLTEKQRKRFDQIYLQRSHILSPILSAEFRKAAKLTDEQIDQIVSAMPSVKATLPWIQRNQVTGDLKTRIDEGRKELPQALALLTKDQLGIWNELVGELLPADDLARLRPTLPEHTTTSMPLKN